jgi:DNA-binding transcriptional LysR family regulator
MQAVLEFIHTVLDPLSIVIGLVLAVPVFWTWYQVVWGSRRRYRLYLQAIRTTPGQRPAILIIDLLPERNIRAAVENYAQQYSPLRQIPRERVFHLQRNGLNRLQLDAFQADLRQQVGEMYAQGVDRIHYFHAGPSMAAAMVGAALSNACPVLLYHYEGLGYQEFGLLKLSLGSAF